MKKVITIDNEYKQWVADLKRRVKGAQVKAALRVNNEMIRLYWSIGADIVQKRAENRWGDRFFEILNKDLQSEFPDVKGFSVRNLQYMKQMYSVFGDGNIIQSSDGSIAPQLVAQILDNLCHIPWGHIRTILDKRLPFDKSVFYVCKTMENGWSRGMLLNMIDTKLFESQGKAITNFTQTLPPVQSDCAKEVLKDPYNLDFLTLREDYQERDLQRALENNISRFLLELGKGFSFVGRQVNFTVAGDEYYCDLLFYHIRLKRYIVVELKTVKFEPEFVSKLNFYCNAVNHQLKGEDDLDTIGLLICKEKNDIVVQWTLENLPIPIGVSKYELTNLIPVAKDLIPSDEEIEQQVK